MRLMPMRKIFIMVSLAAGFVALPATAPGQALSQPEGWDVSVERFVAMPPGFHIATSPSVLLYHPEATADGEFSVESEGFLFRGDSADAYGLFVGGRELDGDAATWTSFEVARDGTWVVRERRDGLIADVAGPESGPVATPGDEVTAKNVLGISVGASDVTFRLNGKTVTALPRSDLAVDGVVGFRVGTDLNLHLSTLTIAAGADTVRWAPAADEAVEGGS